MNATSGFFNSTIISACIARNFSLEFSLPTLEPVTFVLIFLAYAPIHCRFTLRLFLLAFKTPFFFAFSALLLLFLCCKIRRPMT